MKALIVEDEPKSAKNLESLINRTCNDVDVLAICSTLEEAKNWLHKHTPDLIFLDIHLPDGMGYDLIDGINDQRTKVIFTSAYDHFALKAFELGAIHYILKPIDTNELQEAVRRVTHPSSSASNNEIQFLKNAYQNGLEKVALSTNDGLELISFDQINFCESSGSYTIFHLLSQEQLVSSKSLLKYEQALQQSYFIRIHDRYLINLKQVKKYLKGRGGQVVMPNDKLLPVSQRKKEHFLTVFRELFA